MDLAVGHLLTPLPCLDVQVLKLREGAGIVEITLALLDAGFHLALRLRIISPAGIRPKSIAGRQPEKVYDVPDSHTDAYSNHRLGVVEKDLQRNTADEFQSPMHEPEERRHALRCDELHIPCPGPRQAEYKDKAGDSPAVHTDRAAVSPVDLRVLARQWLVRFVFTVGLFTLLGHSTPDGPS